MTDQNALHRRLRRQEADERSRRFASALDAVKAEMKGARGWQAEAARRFRVSRPYITRFLTGDLLHPSERVMRDAGLEP